MNAVVIAGYIVAFLLCASRLIPFTKPFWTIFPKAVQSVLPSIVAAIPVAITSFQETKTTMDFVIAVLVVGALFVPGAQSPHVDPPPPTSKSDIPPAPKAPAGIPPIATAIFTMVLCFALSSCSLFGSKGPIWPAIAKCTPAATEVVSAIEQVLISSGDPESALEALAEKYGA